ncbi:hypothetical protein [Moorena sp. SIO3I6]|nr:hypothetical protein [Moorena sp. SIO3I6]
MAYGLSFRAYANAFTHWGRLTLAKRPRYANGHALSTGQKF